MQLKYEDTMNVRPDQLVMIINEIGELLPDVYKVIDAGDKLVTVTGPGGQFRIHKSRISAFVNERSKDVTKTEKKVEQKPATAVKAAAAPQQKKAKKLEAYDLIEFKKAGVLLHKGPDPFPPQNPTMKRDSYVWISADGTQERVFNLYDGSLGKKGKVPKVKTIDKEQFPDLDSRKQKWIKQGYKVKN